MAEPRSPLAGACVPGPFGAPGPQAGVTLRERPLRRLVQLHAWPDRFDALAAALRAALGLAAPSDCRRAVAGEGLTVFRVAPTRLWLALAEGDEAPLDRLIAALAATDAVATRLDHARTVIRISGREARTLLSRGLPVDIDAAVLPEQGFIQSLIHHVPVLAHRLPAPAGAAAFDLFVPREYALSFWEWLQETAAPLGGHVGAAP